MDARGSKVVSQTKASAAEGAVRPGVLYEPLDGKVGCGPRLGLLHSGDGNPEDDE